MDIKTVLEDRNIKYQQKGKDYIIRCLNPEHEDKNPSLRIDKISGVFNCLSCGFAGNIYKYFKINKTQVIDQKVQQLLEKITALQNTKSLPIPLDAVYYDRDYRGIKKSTLRKFGAFTSESMPKMAGRLIFPIYNINNTVIAFQGRYLFSDLEPKYQNEPKNVPLPLYPAIVEPINNSIILVEGFFDMLNLHDKGLTNAVCTFGTAFGNVKQKNKQKKNIERLMQYRYQGIDSIFIMYDGDDAGRNAAYNLKEYIQSIFYSEVVELKDGQDPGGLKTSEVHKIKEELYG